MCGGSAAAESGSSTQSPRVEYITAALPGIVSTFVESYILCILLNTKPVTTPHS
jgi:hypothetical protein